MTFLSSLFSAFPTNKVDQEDIIKFSKKVFSLNQNFKKMLNVYKNSGVKTRFLVEELEWYKSKHFWKESILAFKKHAINLIQICVEKTLKHSKKRPDQIGAIVVINTTGISTPSLDVELFNVFNFKNTIKRLPLFGYGCAGGVLGMNRAVELYEHIKEPVLVCNVELCSLTFRPHIFSKENIVSTALFGDGACSYLIDKTGDCKIEDSIDYTWKNSTELMGWGVEDDGFSVIFDKSIPDFINKNLYNIVKPLIKNKNTGYILHPGGMKIINAYKKIFNNHESINISQEALSEFGNVSSTSVLLVLAKILERKMSGQFLLSGLGPGFSAGVTKVSLDYAN